jgi:hypothetical protein
MVMSQSTGADMPGDGGADKAAPFPTAILVAAILSLLFGIQTLLNFAFVVLRAQSGVHDPRAPLPFVVGFWSVVLIAALGLCAFLYVAIQILRGAARDTLGNSMASFVFSAMNVAPGVVRLIVASTDPSVRTGPIGAAAEWFVTLALLIPGTGLLIAGLLGLLGRNAYRNWRRARGVHEGLVH